MVGSLARILEHDADLVACRCMEGEGISATRASELASALVTLSPVGSESWFSLWLHPSTTRRIALLQAASVSPDIERSVDRRVRGVAMLLTALGLCLVGMLLASVWL